MYYFDTVATVGYGDIYPAKTSAQVVVVIIIITGFSIIPFQVSKSTFNYAHYSTLLK